MSEPIIPPDLTDQEALRLYFSMLHEWIKNIEKQVKDNESK
jgi:hypothetical protein